MINDRGLYVDIFAAQKYFQYPVLWSNEPKLILFCEKTYVIGNKMTDYKELKDKIAVKETNFVVFINI